MIIPSEELTYYQKSCFWKISLLLRNNALHLYFCCNSSSNWILQLLSRPLQSLRYLKVCTNWDHQSTLKRLPKSKTSTVLEFSLGEKVRSCAYVLPRKNIFDDIFIIEFFYRLIIWGDLSSYFSWFLSGFHSIKRPKFFIVFTQ